MSTNQEIRDWEFAAYTNRDPQDSRIWFDRVYYGNHRFTDFLVDFYDLKNKAILDYAGGVGFFAAHFARYSDAVSGCDLSPELVAFAHQEMAGRVHFFKDDFFNSNLQENTYDFLMCKALGPLQKIDFNDENVVYLKKLISSLKEDGVAYFIQHGNLSGIPGDRLSGLQHYRLDTTYEFFQKAGYVAMINVVDTSQTVVVARSEAVAARYHAKMYWSVTNMLQQLRWYNWLPYLHGRAWLYINRGKNVDINRYRDYPDEFAVVDQYLENTYYPRLVPGLCQHFDLSMQREEALKVVPPLFFVTEDLDLQSSQALLNDLYTLQLSEAQATKAAEMTAPYVAENSVLRQQMEALQAKIAEMEASKFWRIRTAWVRLKKSLGLSS